MGWGARRRETPRWARERRSVLARVVLAVSVAGLLYALAWVQLARSEEFAAAARENMLRPVAEPAPRGTIYDRYGRVVAENRAGYRIQLLPAPTDSLRTRIERLRPVLDLTDAELETAFRRHRASPNLPMVVLSDASLEQVAGIEERRRQFPWVLVEQYPKRFYPAGPAVAHLMGYVAEISAAELAEPAFAGYRAGRWIGKAGLERQYESVLGGEPGHRYLEVDARGGIRRWLPESAGVPAIPGHDLHLHLDLDLQRYGAYLLQSAAASMGLERAEGAFVALDPRTGGVLALYSNPSYDPNLFTGGVPSRVWTALREDPARPLLDRAAGAAQPPGSTFKMTMAAMALADGTITADELMPIPCTGGMAYRGRYARCWTNHGRAMDLALALKHSCNVYFYQVGIRMGFDRFMALGSRLGLGGRTGVDLPSEFPSIYPEGEAWFADRMGYTPQSPEVMSHSIGQGTATMTPLKVAQIVSGVARPDGRMVVPRMAQTEAPPEFVGDYGLRAADLAALRKGMRMVLGPGGTASLSRLAHWDVGGKTGTAQNPHGDDHAWFVGFGAPAEGEPEIVAVVLLYFGKSGSQAASAPAMNAINFHLNRKHGRPFERFATPRERSAAGQEVDWRVLQRPVPDRPIHGYE